MIQKTVVITIQHPAHVHFFRHAIDTLERAGHDVRVFVRNKSVATRLLEAFDIEHTVLIEHTPASMPGIAATQLLYEARLLRAVWSLEPDVIAAIGGLAAAHVATVVDARSVVFTDTEHASYSNRLTFPFADRIVTPECYQDDVGSNQIRYPGYHELAYLHPDRFTPDRAVLEGAGLDPEARHVVLRLIAWNASHDAGETGVEDPNAIVERLEATGARVLLSAEGDIPDSLADRQVDVAPHHLHHLLAHADLFVGEGATMAAESAVLGTPAVYVNTLSMGYTDELADRYGLLYQIDGPNRPHTAIDTAVELLDVSEHDWSDRRRHLLAEKEDTTTHVVSAIGVTA